MSETGLRWAVAGALVIVAVWPAQALASLGHDRAPWVIEDYDVRIDVQPDGSMAILESITVDFREPRRGIVRDIPVHYALPADSGVPLPDPDLEPTDYLRVYEIDDIGVHSETAPDDVHVTEPGLEEGWLTIRVGQEDTWIEGRHRYVIGYTLRGGLNDVGSHTELYWNAVGPGWDAPILEARAVVTGAGLQRTTCFQGAAGAQRFCDGSSHDGDRATFRADTIAPDQALTIVVAFDRDAVSVGPPLLVERFHLGRRLVGSDAAVPLAVLVGLLAFGGVAVLAFRQGRDRETVGGVAVDGTVRATRRRPLLSRATVPVQFRPPDGLRPAQLGLLVDERIDPVDVTATIVDLAVRGHLRIVEDERTTWRFFTSTEHRLVRLEPPPGDELLRYERALLDALFADGDAVSLEDLRGSFHTQYRRISDLVYEDGRARRWFHRSPEKVRDRWLAVGLAALGLSGALTFLLVRWPTGLGVVGLVLGGAALLLVVLHRWMPHRTAAGSQLLVRTLGFKQFIVTAESGRMAFAEQEHLFLEYLPYAVLFGATDRWAEAFEGLDIDPGDHGFYVSTSGLHSLDGLSRSLTTFSSVAGSGLATSPSSSGGSGFSGGGAGGGGGGGGGGSW